MRFITTLSVERPNPTPTSSWGDDPGRGTIRGLQRLIVLVAIEGDSDESATAYAIDPDHVDPARDQVVYALPVLIVRLGTFLKIIVDGDPLPVPYPLEVSHPQPPTTGPKEQVALEYAAALRIDEQFAQFHAA
jgi:hypothetical protein